MKNKKKILVWVLLLALCSPWVYGVKYSEAAEATIISKEHNITVQVDNEEKIVTKDAIERATQKGYITGDGVRLRKAPKSTATVLELMSKNETVLVDYAASSAGSSSGKWFYVKRVKTGTWGWVNADYLAAL